MPDISLAKYSLPLSVCPESGNLAHVSSFELDVEGASMCRYQAVKIIRLGRAKRREFVDLDPKGMYWLEYGNYAQPSMYDNGLRSALASRLFSAKSTGEKDGTESRCTCLMFNMSFVGDPSALVGVLL